jgi:hemerythrin superfamily protein
MNAIKFLIQEHNKVRKVLVKLSKKSQKIDAKIDMFYGLCHDLVIHETMEEKIWYPHFKSRLDRTVKHLVTEEKGAAKAIKKFSTVKTPEEFAAKFAKFKKAVKEHAAEEETKLFPQVKKILDTAELNKIGKDMQKFKKRFK